MQELVGSDDRNNRADLKPYLGDQFALSYLFPSEAIFESFVSGSGANMRELSSRKYIVCNGRMASDGYPPVYAEIGRGEFVLANFMERAEVLGIK